MGVHLRDPPSARGPVEERTILHLVPANAAALRRMANQAITTAAMMIRSLADGWAATAE
jgi:hypothetical protein